LGTADDELAHISQEQIQFQKGEQHDN
jgi:hypothetical protein